LVEGANQVALTQPDTGAQARESCMTEVALTRASSGPQKDEYSSDAKWCRRCRPNTYLPTYLFLKSKKKKKG
ncbi:hypothetical protein, partial [Agrococcus sp. Ld7]|uniref:hypothetical protein n=1 Tax=Agrococcus sp. Ld7 TaxID=649148 RepID=UPI00386AD38A